MRPRYNPRDANEPALVKHAKQLGAHWLEAGPLDGWCFHQGRWMPVEIKLPEREGLKNEYTPAQKRFFTWAQWYNAPHWVWRGEADVEFCLNARRSA